MRSGALRVVGRSGTRLSGPESVAEFALCRDAGGAPCVETARRADENYVQLTDAGRSVTRRALGQTAYAASHCAVVRLRSESAGTGLTVLATTGADRRANVGPIKTDDARRYRVSAHQPGLIGVEICLPRVMWAQLDRRALEVTPVGVERNSRVRGRAVRKPPGARSANHWNQRRRAASRSFSRVRCRTLTSVAKVAGRPTRRSANLRSSRNVHSIEFSGRSRQQGSATHRPVLTSRPAWIRCSPASTSVPRARHTSEMKNIHCDSRARERLGSRAGARPRPRSSGGASSVLR